MTEAEKHTHMKYLLKKLEAREDVILIEYDFHYSTYITFYYHGYVITIEPNPYPAITEHYPGEILFGVKKIVQDYLGQQISYWEEFREFSDIQDYLERQKFPVIENPGIFPLSVMVDRKQIVEANHILITHNSPFAKSEKLYLPVKPYVKGHRILKVTAIDEAGFPSVYVDLTNNKIGGNIYDAEI